MNRFQLGRFSIVLAILGFICMSIPNISFAESTIVTSIDHENALEKTEMTLSIDKNDPHQWAFVEGKIKNPVDDYPVIIQILKDGEFVRVAQVDVCIFLT